MATTITHLDKADAFRDYATIINQNFTNVKNSLDVVESTIDVNNNKITTDDILIEKQARSTSTITSINEASSQIDGNLTVSGTSTLGNVSLGNAKNLTVNSGVLTVAGSTSEISIEGKTTLKGTLVYNNFGDAVVDGSLDTTYESINGTTGTLNCNSKHAMVIDFTNYVLGSDNNYIKNVVIKQGLVNGQTLTLIVNADASAGKPHTILETNIVSLGTGEVISINTDYAVIELVYLGTKWVIKNLYNATIA